MVFSQVEKLEGSEAIMGSGQPGAKSVGPCLPDTGARVAGDGGGVQSFWLVAPAELPVWFSSRP